MSGYSGVVAERGYTSTEIEVIGDIGFPSEVKDVVSECPFRGLDRPGVSSFQVLHYLCDSFFWFSVSSAFSDVSEDVSFFPNDFQAFHRTHREESRGEQGDVRIVIRPGPMVRSSVEWARVRWAKSRASRTLGQRKENAQEGVCLSLRHGYIWYGHVLVT